MASRCPFRFKLEAEIAAARESLTKTEERLRLEHEDLIKALELAEDVQAVYAAADEQTKRGYNQAFFRRIRIRARWDNEQGRTVVEVVGVELTEPYAVLLAEGRCTRSASVASAVALLVGDPDRLLLSVTYHRAASCAHPAT